LNSFATREGVAFIEQYGRLIGGENVVKHRFAPILTPENICKMHKELSPEAQKTLDDMADYLGERYNQRMVEMFPGVIPNCLKREKAREVIYMLVYNGFL
jgi:hypothetical protein